MRSKIFEVVRFEIVRQLKKPAFWAVTLLVPVLIGGIYLISFLSAQSVDKNPELKEDTKVAITDEAGVFSRTAPFLTDKDKAAGKEMVKDGEVDLYFYIPKDFAETKKAEVYHISEGLDIFNNDANILKGLLLQDASSRVSPLDALALNGQYEIVDNKLDHNGENSNALGKAIIPFTIAVILFLVIALCGNRFLLNVVEEKENRISEMILTSISARHLIVGKIIALLALSAVQMLALIIPVAILIFINRDSQMIAPILNTVEVNPVTIILGILLLISAVVFYAGTCTFVGALTSTAKDASSFIGPAIILMVFPLYFMQMFMASSPNAVVQVMTYFPFTAPLSLMLRSGFGTISVLEYCIGIAVVAVSAVVMIRLAVVTFHKNAINFGSPRLRLKRKR